MKLVFASLWTLVLAMDLIERIAGQVTTVVVDGTASHPIPKTLYGQMFEDISSGDGGLYAELLQNRAFQKVTPNTTAALLAWHPINNASLNVLNGPDAPISSALPNYLRAVVPLGSSLPIGFGNEGFWGINVDPSWTYTASFYYRFPVAIQKDLTFIVALDTSTGTRLAASHLTVSGSQTGWKQVKTILRPTVRPPSTANNFTITFDGAEAAGVTVDFALLSLFPPTFRGRENGLRMDIAEALYEMEPAFFRFPGGNNLEVSAMGPRPRFAYSDVEAYPENFRAKQFPLDGSGTRRSDLSPNALASRVGDWSYVNTDGLGLMEYLFMCEDFNMIPIMAVWDGYALGGVSVTGEALAPYIQQAIDQINFVIGDPATSGPAALRASLGRPEPFDLLYVEIGNEDFVGAAPSTVQNRWNIIASNLTATFPQLEFIATSRTSGPVLTPKPAHYDNHVYQTPKWFQTNSFLYDSFARDGTSYFEGEYAVTSTNSSNLFGTPDVGRLVFPTVRGSVGEAAFMTGLERNADIVFAASYAPLLGHVAGSQWTPNLLSFDAGTVYRSTSYYVQKLFSANKGDEYLPSTLPVPAGTLFWSVTRKTTSKEISIKVANNAATEDTLSFELPPSIAVSKTAKAEILTGAVNASNSPATPGVVAPYVITIGAGQIFNFTAPALSVSVLTLQYA